MEFKKPKPKKNYAPKNKVKFPVECNEEIIGVFNGQFVTVSDNNSMNYLYNSGNFGKGTLSKSEPNYNQVNDDIPKVILKHQFENFAKWNEIPNFNSQKSCRYDYTLSLDSIEELFKSSLNAEREGSWKLLKSNEKYEIMETESKFLEFNEEDDGYVDKSFSNFVNNLLKKKQILKPNTSGSKPEQFIVLDSKNETDLSTLANINSKLEHLSHPPIENLNFSLVESFYLKSVLKCLNIVDLNSSNMEVSDLWEKFNAVDKNFTEKYLTYHYYRTKGWVVKSGLKYGGDYLLYKDGPAYYHASYLVKVLDRRKELTWRDFIAMSRLVETFNKDLLLCQVLPSESVTVTSFPDVLSSHTIQEVLVRRWLPTKDRVAKEN